MSNDPWRHRSKGMRCRTCMWFVVKAFAVKNSGDAPISMEAVKPPSINGRLGRCRRHAPGPNGFPPVFENDWCGDHRLDENKT